MVRYLLQLGANVNIETNVSTRKPPTVHKTEHLFLVSLQLMFTPLHSAAQQGHVMIVKLLLEHGASPNKTNKVTDWKRSTIFLLMIRLSSSME
jgi:ankyrin repeat protein